LANGTLKTEGLSGNQKSKNEAFSKFHVGFGAGIADLLRL
jgi:hypothetical protein